MNNFIKKAQKSKTGQFSTSFPNQYVVNFSAFQLDFSPHQSLFPGTRQSFSDVTSTTSSTHGIRKSRSGNLFVSTVKLLRRVELSTSQLNFDIQGRAECELNKLHGCILEHLEFEQAFHIISCLMNSFRSDIGNVSAFIDLSCCRCSAAASRNSISH